MSEIAGSWVGVADEYSLPVWLWPQVITMLMVLGATLSNDWSTFTAFRSLQGLFGTVPQVIGLPIIHDMYSAEGRHSVKHLGKDPV